MKAVSRKQKVALQVLAARFFALNCDTIFAIAFGLI